MLTENNKTSFAYLRRVMCLPLLFLIFVACSRSVDNTLPEKNQQTVKNETDPEYPAGREAWMRYLSKNFKYPKEAVEKEIQGTVVVQFLVDKEGNIHNVKALSGPEELKPEAVRLIKESGKWIPAKNNNQNVNTYRKQPITFRLQEE